MARSRRSSPATGTRFCGARGSLYGVEANRGSVTADRSASSMTCCGGQLTGALDPDDPAPRADRARRAAAGTRSSRLLSPNTGERWPAGSAVTTAVSAAGRYRPVWVLTQPMRPGQLPVLAQPTVGDQQAGVVGVLGAGLRGDRDLQRAASRSRSRAVELLRPPPVTRCAGYRAGSDAQRRRRSGGRR